MSIGHNLTVPIEVAAGTGPSLLVALSSAQLGPESDPPLAAALEAVGDPTGESWLNLLGVALDAGAPYSPEHLLDALAALDGVELRRHLLGRYAWSWCSLAGVDTIEAAAAGDEAAARALLAHPRYYAGHAETSLAVLLPLDAEETRRRILNAVEVASHLLVDGRSAARLDAAADDADAALAELPPLAAIERLTAGYRYVPEPEAERVVLLPHLEAASPLVLAQHRGARLIAYRARIGLGAEARLLALGRALSDPKRVEILALIARGSARVPELVERTGLSRSTVHHHLSQLREAGLVALEGNARSYTYAARPEAVADAAALLGDVLGTQGDQEEE
jgi:DNA-binding transcriptional ArsR family regulator